METEAPLLTVAEVSERLQVSHETVRRLCRSRKLGAIKIGTDWRIPEPAYRSLITPPVIEQTPRTQRQKIAHLLRSA